ncbi:hypothetical protein NE237_017255 [Protea cynaroides]|uniref:tRNA (adenine(58)-N(1))-methyltransferase non-catalytic subunit TRM6 n=1 Tax=Protea cynaroides TaxID=273540 RepID=A0A9Q0K7Q0_9MAGN|nr:hypothetical protein NE237_017255 [Protea cynaroides]
MTKASVQTGSVKNPRTTWEGCSLLLDINDGNRPIFARLSTGSTVKINGNKKCPLQPLIGCPFGSLFQVESSLKGPYLCRVTAPAEDAIALNVPHLNPVNVYKNKKGKLHLRVLQIITSVGNETKPLLVTIPFFSSSEKKKRQEEQCRPLLEAPSSYYGVAGINKEASSSLYLESRLNFSSSIEDLKGFAGLGFL